MESLHRSFQEPSQLDVNETTFRWLDRADSSPPIQEVKARMLGLCPVGAGDDVLDVGCGLGQELLRLAQRVPAPGRLVGVDASRPMILEARRRAGELNSSVEYEVGDAHDLEFRDDTFGLSRTERVLRYLRSPEIALREMARVTRPGGFVLAFDFDSDQTVVDAPDTELTRRIAQVLDAAVPHPWVGRQLFRLFRRVGLVDVRVLPHVVVLSGAAGFAIYRQLNHGTIARGMQAGDISGDEAAAWWGALERAGQTEDFFAAVLGFVVAGRKSY